jgi:allantoinase
MMALQHHTSSEMHTRSMRYFECMYRESAERAKIMSIAHHPYLSGSPHRIDDVENTYKDMLARPGVVCWSGEQILDWYLSRPSEMPGQLQSPFVPHNLKQLLSGRGR